ncbi:unnamed protein product [Aphanomyces euteiches]|uniref:PH domain-containing protein n=1 Tax=Aphanomyces euteiches TaxID=100861 RepID=A0A6G0WEJ1_9STRA|nr:hypothetical protein Ae201684_015883 [Aphanomyces euteiches]KAH9080179.1 hypothetical protein Ae201684P_009125 [Aphanomyces euteiches]KAH9142424.1 hypothetical protein AeRB84_013503 [Aphanomyces euteiches]
MAVELSLRGSDAVAAAGDVVRAGLAFKKGSKKGVFGRANWKLRYLVLSSSELCYFKTPSGELKGVIDLTQCTLSEIQIMPIDCLKSGRSTSSIWRVAIRTPARRLKWT